MIDPNIKPGRAGRKAAILLLAAAMFASPAFSQPARDGALPPGKPAGVKQAEINEVPYLLITGVVTMVLGIMVLYPHGSSSAPAVVVSGTGTS